MQSEGRAPQFSVQFGADGRPVKAADPPRQPVAVDNGQVNLLDNASTTLFDDLQASTTQLPPTTESATPKQDTDPESFFL